MRLLVEVADEAAHFLPETEGPQVADRVFNALVPAAAQFGAQTRIIVASTPFGQGNLFAELFQRASAGELAEALPQHASTAEMNPTVDRAFLERERTRDPESFQAEYEAQFLAGGAAFLDPGRISSAVADRSELVPEQGTGWIAGLDPPSPPTHPGLSSSASSRSARQHEPERCVSALPAAGYRHGRVPLSVTARSIIVVGSVERNVTRSGCLRCLCVVWNSTGTLGRVAALRGVGRGRVHSGARRLGRGRELPFDREADRHRKRVIIFASLDSEERERNGGPPGIFDRVTGERDRLSVLHGGMPRSSAHTHRRGFEGSEQEAAALVAGTRRASGS